MSSSPPQRVVARLLHADSKVFPAGIPELSEARASSADQPGLGRSVAGICMRASLIGRKGYAV